MLALMTFDYIICENVYEWFIIWFTNKEICFQDG